MGGGPSNNDDCSVEQVFTFFPTKTFYLCFQFSSWVVCLSKFENILLENLSHIQQAYVQSSGKSFIF